MAGTLRRLLVVVVALQLSGCGGTSHVSPDVTPVALAAAARGVALMRIGAAGTACRDVAVLLAVPTPVAGGTAYRRHRVIRVAQVNSVTEPAVAEVELEPGEYHVVGYQCTNNGGRHASLTTSDGGQLFRSSYAAFTIAAGEIVNVGHLHVNASHVGRSSFGRPFRVDVRVSDWPLGDLDRYRAHRPKLYAQMTTRLMRVTLAPEIAPATADACAQLRVLRTSGKVQTLPPECV